MSVGAGSRIGPYEVLALIGAGGMGEVYRARDTKLGRDVALKVLPDHLADDPDRLARFRREAQVLASLNHQNIATIYGLEEADSSTTATGSGQAAVRALVLELVEGPTLADRISQGPIPLDEALPIAKQIADALESAHELGIIHRDLKPANVKLRANGTVKVLDFGLAKLTETPGSGLQASGLSHSPTITSPAMMTGAGVILGTTAYMSPEQAKGKAADVRSDVWAFGVVLYEMLSGKPAFPGETMLEVLSGVLKTDPDWTALPDATPPIVRSLLRRCLQRDRNRRMGYVADVRLEIEEALTEPAPSRAPASTVKTGRERLLWLAAMLIAVVASAIAAFYFRPGPTEAPETRLQIVTPPATDVTQFAIAPDGHKVVFGAITDGRARLWLRALGSETAQPLAGTEGAGGPFWSPDSQSVAFAAAGTLRRIDIEGGAPQRVAETRGFFGGTWNADGVILFSPGNTGPLYRVPASGGDPVAVTRVESPRQLSHRFPHFLPDGRHFLFFATGNPGVQGIYVGSLDSPDARRLLDADSRAVFAPPDWVLFVRQESLFAQRLDIQEFAPTGDPILVAEQVASNPNTFGSVALSASTAGPLAYRGAMTVERQLIWFDRSGNRVGTVGEPDTQRRPDTRVSLSPDGHTVGLNRMVNGNEDVWLMETARGVLRRFTSDPAQDSTATWSPDGSRIAFHSSRKGGGLYDLYHKAVDGGPGSEEVLLESSENKNMQDWSHDGRFILFTTQNPQTARDLWALPLEGDRKPFVVVQSAFEETQGRFSPDGHWIAYTSNESGQTEVYVQPFPGPGSPLRISTGGTGNAPQWRGNGREIFYRSPDNRLMAVSLAVRPDGTMQVGNALPLMSVRPGSNIAASPDGQRFLIDTPLQDTPTPPITIILNWAGRKR